MFHPEYQILEFIGRPGFEVNHNVDTEQIAFNLSRFLNEQAKKNSNNLQDSSILKKMLLDNYPVINYPLFLTSFVAANGFVI